MNNPIKHLHQVDLARRWALSPRTLERWRWLGVGPCYLKVGGRVLYRLEDIEAYEAARCHGGAPVAALPAKPQVETAVQRLCASAVTGPMTRQGAVRGSAVPGLRV